MSIAAPDNILTIGQELRLTTYALAYGGEGIARHEGIVVFIPDTIPGDKVRVKILQVKQRFARGELLEVVEPSPNRVEPFCPHAAACGGCSWQTLAYSAQLQAKQTFVENAFSHVGHMHDQTVPQPIKAVPQTGYRHKIQIPIQISGQGFLTGFYAKQTHDVVPIEECPVQPVLGNRVLRTVCETAKTYGYTGYDEAHHTGELRHLVIRLGLNSKEVLLVLVTAQNQIPRLHDFAQELHQQIPELVGVVQNVNTASTNVILGREFRGLTGRPYLYETIRGIRYRISAGSFFQINPFQLPHLAEAVIQAGAPAAHDKVVDLFCGVGFFSLELARLTRMVFGVENVPAAVEDALSNKHLNNLSNVEFIAADALEGVKTLMQKGLTPDLMIVDPPRKGCDQQLLNQIVAWKPQRLVYVSCNPITLARDLAQLTGNGYRLSSVQPIDMFPHTYHIETVVGLTRKK